MLRHDPVLRALPVGDDSDPRSSSSGPPGILFALISQMVIRPSGAALLPPVGYPTDSRHPARGASAAPGRRRAVPPGHRGLPRPHPRGGGRRTDTPELAFTATARHWLPRCRPSVRRRAGDLGGIAIGGGVPRGRQYPLVGGLLARAGPQCVRRRGGGTAGQGLLFQT